MRRERIGSCSTPTLWIEEEEPTKMIEGYRRGEAKPRDRAHIERSECLRREVKLWELPH